MAAKNLSKTFDEMESDDLSYDYETSIPTDLTMSPDHSDGGGDKKKTKITRQLIERKQLVHDMQLLRIELSHKNLVVENMKAESLQKVDELEERLNDALHQKQILQARLESQLTIQQQDSKRRQELIKNELEDVRQRQKHLENVNERLQEKAGNVRRTLKDLDITEERYYEIRGMSEDDMSLRDYVAIQVYDMVRPVRTEAEQLRLRVKSLEGSQKSTATDVLQLQEKLDEERQAHGELRVKYQKLVIEFAETKSQVKTDDYKVENYSKVKQERDNFECDQAEIHRQHVVLEASYQSLQKERDDLQRELSAAKQSVSLLQQDKDYLNRQVSDLGNRRGFLEEKMAKLTEQVDGAKQSREEMYEKYVASRDQYKAEYENKLREELEQIRRKTNDEIDRLRTSTKEMYERENRNLREARDMAVSERERSLDSEKDVTTKYEQLLTDFRHLQATGDSRMSDLLNDVKIKGFESERTQMLYEETVRNLKESQLEVEKLQKKLEVLTKEYYSMQNTLEKKVMGLESSVSDKDVKLETYEKLEKELDDVVMQAAAEDEGSEAEKVLFSYGYGANVPTTSKRRLHQSVHLARRVLQLEKANTSMRHEVDREKSKMKQLAEELKNSNTLLEQSQQPYNYLIDSMRSKESQICKQREYISSLEQENENIKKEKSEVMRMKNQMSLDLERLLNQKEELAVMKQVVLSMSVREPSRKNHPLIDITDKRASSLNIPKGDNWANPEGQNIHKPGAISMVNEKPQWFSKLKQKSMSQSSKYSKVYATAKD
ncbi:hypothetical protein ScPMuIL_011412 [Solemya velum]